MTTTLHQIAILEAIYFAATQNGTLEEVEAARQALEEAEGSFFSQTHRELTEEV